METPFSRAGPAGPAPTYWALRWVAKIYVILGFAAMIIGAGLILYGIFGIGTDERLGTHGVDGTMFVGRALICTGGGATLFYGLMSVAVGQALAAFRDMAINSFLGLGR